MAKLDLRWRTATNKVNKGLIQMGCVLDTHVEEAHGATGRNKGARLLGGSVGELREILR